MNDHNPVGFKIKELRVKRGLNQSDTADIFSVSPSTISHWENGKRLPSIIELQKIADYYQVPFHFFSSSEEVSVQSITGPASSNQQTQSIEITACGYPTHPMVIVLQVMSGLMLIISVMMRDIIGQILFALSALAIIAIVVVFYAKDHARLKTSFRQWTVPISLKFRYEHIQGDHTIKTFKSRLLSVSILAIITTAVAIICSTQSLLNSDHNVSNVFLSFMGLVVVGIAYGRYEVIRRSIVIARQIPYNEAPTKLRHRILSIEWLVDLAVFTGVGLHIILEEGELISAFAGCALTFALLSATLSFIILTQYKSFLMGFSICTTDNNGKTVRMK